MVYRKGFTIIEMLIVISIIAVLATISVVAYLQATQQSLASSLQADMNTAAKQLQLYYAEKGLYPTANNCSNPTSTEICLRTSGTNSFNYVVNNISTPSFSLIGTNGSYTYQITSSSAIGTIPSIVTSGLLVYLDAANSTSYPGSGTTWYDLSGNMNDASLLNGPTFVNNFGGSLSFDGLNDYILTSSITGFKSFNVFGSFGTGSGYIIDARLGFTGYIYVGIGGWQNLYVNAISYPVLRSNIPALAPISLYANGSSNYTGQIHFMCRYSNTECIKGLISVVLIYDRNLTALEIQQNFNALRGRYGI